LLYKINIDIITPVAVANAAAAIPKFQSKEPTATE
jgi:hypothetical protein